MLKLANGEVKLLLTFAFCSRLDDFGNFLLKQLKHGVAKLAELAYQLQVMVWPMGLGNQVVLKLRTEKGHSTDS
jgi:hypothetical protein